MTQKLLAKLSYNSIDLLPMFTMIRRMVEKHHFSVNEIVY